MSVLEMVNADNVFVKICFSNVKEHLYGISGFYIASDNWNTDDKNFSYPVLLSTFCMPSHLITKIDSWGKKLFPQFCRKGN